MRSIILSILLLSSFLLSACGHKAPPKPLLNPLPNPVGDLTVRQLGDAMLIRWTAPRINQDGSQINDLDHYALYRMSYDPTDECPECRDTSVLLRDIDPNFLQDVQFEAGRFALLDRQELVPGRGYQYRLQAVTKDGFSGTPAKVRRAFFAPPQAPNSLQGQSLEGMIRLRWQPVAGSDEMTVQGYRIYRSRGESPLSLRSINSNPEPSAGYDDFSILGDQEYRYAIRSVWQKEGVELESKLSKIVRIHSSAR